MEALNRFASIFSRYFGGALIGVRQALWPQERQHSGFAHIFAGLSYLALMLALLLGNLSHLDAFGLALILFSPQWLYVAPVGHPVFEFRGYGMAAGVALLLGPRLALHWWLFAVLVLLWTARSLVRRRILIEPLRFWATAQEENAHGS